MMRAVVVLVVVVAVAAGVFWSLRGGRDVGPPGAGRSGIGVAPTPSAADGPAPDRSAPPQDPRARLRVVLLGPDMRTPAAGRTLQVYRHTPGKMALPEYVRTVRTDGEGVAAPADLEDGAYIVCAPGAAPGSPAPLTARAAVGGAEPVTVRLVEPAAASPVSFEVRAAFEPRYGVASKLVLRRVDDGSGALHEQPGVLRPGANAFELDLPRGRYELGVLPLGELVVDAAVRELVVGPDPRAVVVALAENPRRVDVVLEGLPADQLPARVYPQPAEVLLTDRPERSWWGPYRWHRPDLQVPALDGPRRVVVFGQTATFRGREIALLDGDRADVALEPAVRVVVDWFGWDPERDADAVVVATAGTEEVARTLAPRFGDGYPWLERPALGGELVVGRSGAVRLECRRGDGSLAWERTVDPGPDPVHVRID